MKAIPLAYTSFARGWDHSRWERMAYAYIFIILILAITGPLISNEKPYRCSLEGKTYYPLFSGGTEAELSSLHPASSPVNWRTTSFQSIWYAPVPYSYSTIDLKAGNHLSPFSHQAVPLKFRHWLGTDVLGRDVLAGMIRGCAISLLIGIGSMLLALLIGVPLGSAAAYWGNRNRKIIKKIPVPVDTLVMGLISIIDSFPALFIIMILLVLIPVKGWLIVMCVIALLRWPVMARYMRAEVFKLKESNYIKSAMLLNIPDMRILYRHLIPYAFRPVLISFIFGISSAILAESALSFLGIGLPAEEVNWGRLLAQSRNHFDDWWLVFFPGCAIFFTMISLYTIGNSLQKGIR